MESSSDLKDRNREDEQKKNHPKVNKMLATILRAFGLYQYEGFWYHIFYLEGVKLAQKHFQSEATDIVLCSAPKSGTTWLKALSFAIITRNLYDSSSNPLLVKLPHDCVPLLEVDIAKNSTKEGPKSQLLSTHIPYSSLPMSVISSGCKIVYVCRDPKDAFVSYWQFIKKVRPVIGLLPLNLHFELFCNGVSYYGPYWDHVLGYWKASLEQPERVMFLRYEDMKRETSFCVKNLAEFIGHPFDSDEEKDGVIGKIINSCSFESLSNLEVNKSGKHRPETPVEIANNTYFRKGEIGDCKNYLSVEMIQRMDAITEEKLGGFGLKFGA